MAGSHAGPRDKLADSVSDNGFAYDDDDSFLQEGIVDSVGVLELVLFVEETFGVAVDDQDITPDNFDSVNKLADYIRRHVDGT